jgi:hypothetical protein
MAARTFQDSSGAVWEVFEVHRSSSKPGAVSSGLEGGWLSFVSGEQRRRLAPYPSEWERAGDEELVRLCESARVAQSPRFPTETGERRRTPRERPRPLADPTPSFSVESTPPSAETVSGGEVESMVRTFAHRSRMDGLPAIEAMVRLKLLLAEQFPQPDSDARDLRRVRRWFVEAYYFERDG